MVVTAKYKVVVYRRASDGSAGRTVQGTVQGSAGREVVGASYLFTRSWPVRAEAGRANFTGAVRETVAGAYNITFRVRGSSSAVADLLASEVLIRPSAPELLRLMRQPGGGEACAPLGSQPSLLLKDGYNNTVSLLDGVAVVASAVVGVGQPHAHGLEAAHVHGLEFAPAPAGTLLGVASQNLAAGGAAFGSLGVNSTGRAWRLVFSLDSNSSAAAAAGGGIHLTATSDAFDCHGAPAALRSLPGWPPMIEVVDVDGVRATGVGGEVELRSYLEFPDGGVRQHGHLVRRFRDPHDVWRADLSPNGGHTFGMYETVHDSWYGSTSQIEVGLDGVGSMGFWESLIGDRPPGQASGAGAEFTPAQMEKAGYTQGEIEARLNELRRRGMSAQKASEAGYSPAQIEKAGYTPGVTMVSRGDARGYGGSPRYAEAGVWVYTLATDPLMNRSDAAASIALIFRANISGGLSLDFGREVGAGLVNTDRGLRMSGGCCELVFDEESFGVIASLYVPQIRIVRLRALNTGLQGGYGRGDSIEVSFNIKTDRAGLPLREVFDRTILDRLVILEDDEDILRSLDGRRRRLRSSLGDSPAAVSGVWADNCTLLIVAGRNLSGAFSETGVTTARVRDDILELYDMRQRLREPSTARSVLMTGNFGATTGLAGRLHPLRQALDDRAMRRYVGVHAEYPDQDGPLVWHDGGTGDTRDQLPEDTVYGVSECEAEAPAPSMASFESRYGAERWTAIEGYYNPNTRRMVYMEEPQANMEAWSDVYSDGRDRRGRDETLRDVHSDEPDRPHGVGGAWEQKGAKWEWIPGSST